MVGAQMNVAGVLLGFILPNVFVDDYDSNKGFSSESEKEKYKQQLFNMLLASSIFGTVITLLVLFTFKEKAGASLFGKSTGRL